MFPKKRADMEVRNSCIEEIQRVSALHKSLQEAFHNSETLEVFDKVQEAILKSLRKVISSATEIMFNMDKHVIKYNERQVVLSNNVYEIAKEQQEEEESAKLLDRFNSREHILVLLLQNEPELSPTIYQHWDPNKVIEKPTKKLSIGVPLDGYPFWVTSLGYSGVINISNMKMLLGFAPARKLNYDDDDDDGSNELSLCNGSPILGFLPKILLVATGFLVLMLLLPYDPTNDVKVPKIIFNNCSPSIFHFWVISTMFAFCGSLVGLKLMYKKPKFANFSGYVAVLAMLSAFAVLAFSIMA